VPSDSHQGAALARVVFENGGRTVVPLWRGDVWGDDMDRSVRDAFVRLGGGVDQGVRFNPSASSFKTDVETLAARVGQAQAGGSEVTVVFLGFGPEAPKILEEAALHPALASVAWYGSEGTVLSREVIDDAEAASFAAATGFLHPMFADSDAPRAEAVRERLKVAVASDSIHYCAMAAYDAVWLAALSAAIGGTDDADAFESVFEALSTGYEGVTGQIELDLAGDRIGSTYDLWEIRSTGSGFSWTKVSSAGN
jgi:branched-chain amino acid transport system substrate-binding protein